MNERKKWSNDCTVKCKPFELIAQWPWLRMSIKTQWNVCQCHWIILAIKRCLLHFVWPMNSLNCYYRQIFNNTDKQAKKHLLNGMFFCAPAKSIVQSIMLKNTIHSIRLFINPAIFISYLLIWAHCCVLLLFSLSRKMCDFFSSSWYVTSESWSAFNVSIPVSASLFRMQINHLQSPSWPKNREMCTWSNAKPKARNESGYSAFSISFELNVRASGTHNCAWDWLRNEKSKQYDDFNYFAVSRSTNTMCRLLPLNISFLQLSLSPVHSVEIVHLVKIDFCSFAHFVSIIRYVEHVWEMRRGKRKWRMIYSEKANKTHRVQ